MNDAVLKNYAAWARRELIEGVKLQMSRWAIDEEGSVPASADTLHGEPLSARQRTQRGVLLDMCKKQGYDGLVEQAAYTWFNRFIAVRFMELHDYLPCGMRMLSAVDGSFDPQALREALHVDIEGLDRTVMAKLVQAGEREPQFRYLLLCQCDELASCMPAIFERVGSAMELLLPGDLLREGSVIERMVLDIPESDWRDGVEILGWMYQYYNAELKDEFFKSKRKAAQKDIAPATQLFTPNWIVRYMVENSLGRLWMLNNPKSGLRDHMDYYIEPDGDHEDFIRIKSPEDITFCDPACGSGHILVYAFSLLFEMYLEQGYREREIPELILTKNLSGLEIDERAAQIATLALSMCAREHDRRFFSRDVATDVRVLKPVVFGKKDKDAQEERPVPRALEKDKELAEALAHLDEIGSLFVPSISDMAALDDALAETPAGDLFAQDVREHLELAKDQCEVLSRAYDVVVANPPYMGSSSFNAFTSKWIKSNYQDFKSDLFAAFISRIGFFCKKHGEVGIMSPFVWMFIGSYEKLRNKLIDEKTLTSLVQLEYSGFAGATVPICTFTFHNAHIDGYKGGYVRLSDFVGANIQGSKTLEAIQNPGCGWFYRADATTFHDIPGSPIAYWASEAVRWVFEMGDPLGNDTPTHLGMATCDNERFLRYWWEPSDASVGTPDDFASDSPLKRWAPYNKGGIFRKWSGNDEYVVDWKDSGRYIDSCGAVMVKDSLRFKEMSSWTRVSSGMLAVRHKKPGYLFDMTGPGAFGTHADLIWRTAFLNSSTAMYVARFMSASLDFQPGQIGQYPILSDEVNRGKVISLAKDCLSLSQADWNMRETSWDFGGCPLVGCSLRGNTNGLRTRGAVLPRPFSESCIKRFLEKGANKLEIELDVSPALASRVVSGSTLTIVSCRRSLEENIVIRQSGQSTVYSHGRVILEFLVTPENTVKGNFAALGKETDARFLDEATLSISMKKEGHEGKEVAKFEYGFDCQWREMSLEDAVCDESENRGF